MATAFVDSTGTRHQLNLPPAAEKELLSLGSRTQQERYLLQQGYLEPDLPPAPAAAADAPEPASAALAAEALAELQARLQGLQAEVSQYATRDQLGALQQSLATWSAQAARVALSHSELAALADQTVAVCQQMSDAAQSRLAELDSAQATMAAAISSQLADAESRMRGAVTDADRRVAALETAVATDPAYRGPQGEGGPIGLAGSSVTVAMEDPTATDPTSWAMRWYGREGLVPGDGALVPTANALRVFRFTGSQWLEGPAIEPRVEMVNATVSAVNTGNTVFTMQNAAGAGGSGSGGDPLLVRSVAGATGGSMQLSDSSRWAIPLKVQGLASPTAAKLAIQLTAADGPQAGKNLFLVIGILYEPGASASGSTRFSEYSVLGDLRPNLEVGFDIQLQPAGVPGGISIAVPAGTNAAAVYMTITRNATGATSFIVSGACEWLLNQDNVPSSVRGSLQPAWQV